MSPSPVPGNRTAGRLRIALAQVRLFVGDLETNAATVRRVAAGAAAAGADLVAFPELTLCGYPPEDLVLRPRFVTATRAAADALAADLAADGLGALPCVVGYLDRDDDGRPQNRAGVLFGGAIVADTAKMFLPNYGVWDESRYFSPGSDLLVVRAGDADVAITICEDIWRENGRAALAAQAGVDVVLCLNGSPFEHGKDAFRRGLCHARALEAGAPVAYVNQVGGQDELVFDGGSLVVTPGGDLLARAHQFVEDLLVLDVGGPEPAAAAVAPHLPDLEQTYRALVLGTGDYVRKNGFASVALGLSGGIDSALTATIAVDALGADAVHTVAMPSSYSSQHSLDDAEELARRQGTRHRVVEIKPMVEAYQDALDLGGLAEENLQARVRGTLLMGLSNDEGHLILATGNKSELATGFSTLYGDSAGGYAPLKDVPKTMVWALARWRNEQAAAAGETEPIPPASITKPPSAELAPGQLDQDRLPPYELLDAVLDAYVEHDRSAEDLEAEGYDPALVARVIRLVELAEYKRHQYPPGPKVSRKAFGRDRRMPITNRWRAG